MSAQANLNSFISEMQDLYNTGNDISPEAREEINRFVKAMCQLIHKHLLTAEVNTDIIAGTANAGPYPVTGGKGKGGLK